MTSQPQGPRKASLRSIRAERYTQALLALILWWAVYWQVSRSYGLVTGIVAATCASWGFVLLSTWVGYLLDRYWARAEGPGKPRPPNGRWPGSAP